MAVWVPKLQLVDPKHKTTLHVDALPCGTSHRRLAGSARRHASRSINIGRKYEDRDLTPKQTLSVRCPTCGVPPGKPCELSAGGLRNAPHRDRELSAAEAFDRSFVGCSLYF